MGEGSGGTNSHFRQDEQDSQDGQAGESGH